MQKSLSERIAKAMGPLPKQKEARAFATMAIIGAVLACVLSLYYGSRGEVFMGRHLGGDFLQYYSAGHILNQGTPAQLYDTAYLEKLEHEIMPTFPKDQVGIYGYAPWMAHLFRPFAALPYIWGYAAWLLFSAALYCSGLWILLRGRLPADYARTAWLLACSTPMFAFETWIGGQTSIIAFFAAACFVRAFESQQLFAAGLALGLFVYKPSLLAIPLFLMLVLRAWRMLAGVSVVVVITTLASLATGGVQGIRLWLTTMDAYKNLAISGSSLLKRNKYVDLNSFFALLMGESALVRYLSYAVIAAALFLLARCASHARLQSAESQRLLWAGVLVWTQIINIYVPVYDTVLLIPALALAAPLLLARGRKNDQVAMGLWLLALWLLPWLTQATAEFLGIQLITILLAGCGWWLLETGQKWSVATPESPIFGDSVSAEMLTN